MDGACGNPLDYCWNQFLNCQAGKNGRNQFVWNSKSIEGLFKMEPSVIQAISEKSKTCLQTYYPDLKL